LPDCGNAAIYRVGQYGDEWQAFFTQTRQSGGSLGHLHQGNQRFLHARTARSGEAHQWATLLQCDVGRLDETLADDGAHGATHEGELERANRDRHALEGTAHGDQRVLLAGLLLRTSQAILVLLAVAELQAINRLQVGADLLTTIGIEEQVDASARAPIRMW
jgi:hypothetical protein